MRFAELQPQFIKYENAARSRVVDAMSEADGVQFLCPKCYAANGGAAGTHQILCWLTGVPSEAIPGPGRWMMVGTGVHDLSLVAASSSVKLLGGCQAHFFVTKGEIQFA